MGKARHLAQIQNHFNKDEKHAIFLVTSKSQSKQEHLRSGLGHLQHYVALNSFQVFLIKHFHFSSSQPNTVPAIKPGLHYYTFQLGGHEMDGLSPSGRGSRRHCKAQVTVCQAQGAQEAQHWPRTPVRARSPPNLQPNLREELSPARMPAGGSTKQAGILGSQGEFARRPLQALAQTPQNRDCREQSCGRRHRATVGKRLWEQGYKHQGMLLSRGASSWDLVPHGLHVEGVVLFPGPHGPPYTAHTEQNS